MLLLAWLGALALVSLTVPAPAAAAASEAPAAAKPASLTLEDAFRAALQRSETLAQQAELITQAEERYRQTVGGVLPSLSLNASYGVQDNPDRANAGSLSPTTQPLVRLTAVQPLFRGLREYAALRQAKKLEAASREQLRNARLQLFRDLAQAYFDVAALEGDLANFKVENQLYTQRIAELRGRVRIGRSRVSEVLTVESTQATLRAQVEQTQGQLASTREVLAFLTGLPADTPLGTDLKNLPKAQALESYLARIEARPDLGAARLERDAADEAIAIAKGAHLPSVDLSGNYYLKRYGINEDVKWDAALALSFPIFAGGVIQSQVRVAASQREIADLALERARRAATEEIRQLYAVFQTSVSQVQALERSADLAQRNWQQQQREYRLGLVTNIDVLTALTLFEQSQRSLDRARATARFSFARLQAAAGQLPG
jgi:outer membrane protein